MIINFNNNAALDARREELLNTPAENMTEAQLAIAAFEKWQDALLEGELRTPRRYEAEALEFYEGVLENATAPFYFMFMGFIGGMDFVKKGRK